jgi:hypothetical protein
VEKPGEEESEEEEEEDSAHNGQAINGDEESKEEESEEEENEPTGKELPGEEESEKGGVHIPTVMRCNQRRGRVQVMRRKNLAKWNQRRGCRYNQS